MTTRIRRWIETDTGHRVPNHKSKCRNIHGHRYRWEVELEGEVVSEGGVSDEGMLMDFSDISTILTEHIHDVVDHAFIVYENDAEAIEALSFMGDGHKTVKVPFIPTAENLAKWAFDKVEPQIRSSYGNNLFIRAFHVRETPKSWASWFSEN
jgi:6-pyruvoyltetrahydropterin/6-carboxytetrahydropterin synthase